MSKLKKYTILIVLILALAFLLTIKPNGKYFVPVAELMQKKAQTDETKRMHTLDLEKYRSVPSNQ